MPLDFSKIYTHTHNVFVVIEFMLAVIVPQYNISYRFASRVYFIMFNATREKSRNKSAMSALGGYTHHTHNKLKHLLYGPNVIMLFHSLIHWQFLRHFSIAHFYSNIFLFPYGFHCGGCCRLWIFLQRVTHPEWSFCDCVWVSVFLWKGSHDKLSFE